MNEKSKIKVKPTNGFIVVQPLILEERTKAGVIKTQDAIIREAKELAGKPLTVLAIADGLPDAFKVGDKVFIDENDKNNITTITTDDGEDYHLIHYGCIIGVQNI